MLEIFNLQLFHTISTNQLQTQEQIVKSDLEANSADWKRLLIIIGHWQSADLEQQRRSLPLRWWLTPHPDPNYSTNGNWAIIMVRSKAAGRSSDRGYQTNPNRTEPSRGKPSRPSRLTRSTRPIQAKSRRDKTTRDKTKPWTARQSASQARQLFWCLATNMAQNVRDTSQ